MTKEEMAQKIAAAIERGDSDLRGSVEILQSEPAVICVEDETGDMFFMEVRDA